ETPPLRAPRPARLPRRGEGTGYWDLSRRSARSGRAASAQGPRASSFLHLGFRAVRLVRLAEEEEVGAEVTAEHAAPAADGAGLAHRLVAKGAPVQAVREGFAADLAAVDR